MKFPSETEGLHTTDTVRRMKNIDLSPEDIMRLAACQTPLQRLVTRLNPIGNEVHKEILRLIPILEWEEDIYIKSFLNRIKGESPAFHKKYIEGLRDKEQIREIALGAHKTLCFGQIINYLMEMEIFKDDPVGIMNAISAMKDLDEERSSSNRTRIVRMCAYQSKQELFDTIELCKKIQNDLGGNILDESLRIIEIAGHHIPHDKAMKLLRNIHQVEASIREYNEGGYTRLLYVRYAKLYRGSPEKLASISDSIQDMVQEIGPVSLAILERAKCNSIEDIDKKCISIMFGKGSTRAAQAEA
ncbi:MAG: hypothetical protein NTX63_04525 [Candidatus Peregrinibacteria bacterium]|nr:hypothetical protein [Candidatus Peregrinibacteria bacterium]